MANNAKTLSLIRSLVKEHLNNTLGNLKARESLSKKRRRPLSATKTYGRYVAMKEDLDKAEEAETRAEEVPVEKSEVKKSIKKPEVRKKVPGPNLSPENLSIN